MRYISVTKDRYGDQKNFTVQVCRDGLTAFMDLTPEDIADLVSKVKAAATDRKEPMLGADIGVPEPPEDDIPF